MSEKKIKEWRWKCSSCGSTNSLSKKICSICGETHVKSKPGTYYRLINDYSVTIQTSVIGEPISLTLKTGSIWPGIPSGFNQDQQVFEKYDLTMSVSENQMTNFTITVTVPKSLVEELPGP